MRKGLRLLVMVALGLSLIEIIRAEPAGITRGYQLIGWKNDLCIVVEEIAAPDGSTIRRLEMVNPATQSVQPILSLSSKDAPAKTKAFEAKIADLRRTEKTGLIVRGLPSVAKTEGAAGMVSAPIVLFPEQSPQMRPRIQGHYFLDLVSARGNFQQVAELTAWLQLNHPKIFEPSLAWGPNFYIDEIGLSPQGTWAAVPVEVHYGISTSKDEQTGAVLAFFRAKTLSAKLYNLDGYKAYQIKEFYVAIPYFQWAVAQDPAFDIPVYNLACTYGLLGLDEPAVTCLVQACRMNPQNKEKARTDPDLAALRVNGKLDFLLK